MRFCTVNLGSRPDIYCINCIESRKVKHKIMVYIYHDIGAVVSTWLSKNERYSSWFPTER